VFAILAQIRMNGPQVFRTVCYGPFETIREAREFATEFLCDTPVTVVQLLSPATVSASAFPSSPQRQLFAS